MKLKNKAQRFYQQKSANQQTKSNDVSLAWCYRLLAVLKDDFIQRPSVASPDKSSNSFCFDFGNRMYLAKREVGLVINFSLSIYLYFFSPVSIPICQSCSYL